MLKKLTKLVRTIGVIAFWVIAATVGVMWYNYANWTPQTAEKAEIRDAIEGASETAANKSSEIYSAMNAGFQNSGDVNTRTLRDTILPRAAKANEIRQAYEEGVATADGKTVRQAALFVDATNPQWQGHITFAGSLMIYGVSGYVETDSGVGHYTSTPDGIPKAKGLDAFRLPLDNDQLHQALIGRVCDMAGCTDPFFVGSGKTLCPAQSGKTGWVELKVNQHDILYHDNKGGYNYNHKPAPSEACP